MKVGRQYVGKLCEVIWMDPCSGHVRSRQNGRSDIGSGTPVLATQREYGVVDNITDGVLRIIHTAGTDSLLAGDDRAEDLYCTWVHEALITKITAYKPEEESTSGLS